MKLVAFDKKRTATNVRMVLLEDVGRAQIESVPLEGSTSIRRRTRRIW